MKGKRLVPLTENPSKAVPRSHSGSHNYRCSEGKKRCYLRYMADGRRAANKRRNIAKDLARKAYYKEHLPATLRGTARAVRRLESGITRYSGESPAILSFS